MDDPKQLELNLAAAQAARDEGMERVLANAGVSFFQKVLAVLATKPAGTELTGEDIRVSCLLHGVIPHHYNVWGSVTRQLTKMGLLKRTDKYKSMRTKKSHARKTPVYVRVE